MRSIEATIVLLIFVFPASVFAQNSLDGYFWEKADVFKPMILTSSSAVIIKDGFKGQSRVQRK